jgi:precorrin-6B methylase 2
VSRVNVAIAIAEDARSRIYEIAASCRALGFEHLSTLADIGVLTGSAEVHALPRIEALPGVVAVEIAREFRARQRSAMARSSNRARAA